MRSIGFASSRDSRPQSSPSRSACQRPVASLWASPAVPLCGADGFFRFSRLNRTDAATVLKVRTTPSDHAAEGSPMSFTLCSQTALAFLSSRDSVEERISLNPSKYLPLTLEYCP